MDIVDDKLDTYITNIKDSELSESDILLNYKKATKRISILKTKYNKINELNKPKPKSKSKKKTESDSDSESDSESDDMPIEELVAKLDRIKSDLESESSDLSSILNLYVEYHKLISSLESKHTELQNQFYKIDTNKSDIIINKIDLDHIL